MKKIIYLLAIVLCTSIFVACGDDGDNIDYEWKQANEDAFSAVANDPEFTRIFIPGGPGSVYIKSLNGQDDVIGTEKPKYTSTVRVAYKGWLVNNAVFDSSDSYDMAIASVVDGWKVALQNMKAGEKWQVWIPWSLGYGTAGSGNIAGYSTLVFDITLEKILS